MRTPLSRQSLRTISRASSAVVRPVHVPAEPLDVVGELAEVDVEPLERRLLDRARLVAQRLALAGSPSKASRRRPMNFVVAMPSASCRKRVAERAAGALGKRRRQPASSLTRRLPPAPGRGAAPAPREPRRDSPPPICMRHPPSHATRQSAPGPLDVVELLVEDGRRHLGQPHRERSAEAAALVGARAARPARTPATPRSSARGARDSPSPRRRWQESW